MDNKRKFPIYMIPLLAVPIVASMFLTNRKQPKGYSFPTETIRTEAEKENLTRESLESTIGNFKLNYLKFMDLVNFKRTLPVEYDNWEVSVVLNGNFINWGRQTAVDFSEDGLGKKVQIDISKQEARNIIESYRK